MGRRPAPTEPAWRRRVELWFEGGRLTALDVPVLGVISTAKENDVIGHLGPDLCAADPPDIEEIVARLQHDPSASCQQIDDRRCVDIDRARRLLALHPARREPTFPR